MTRRIHRLPLIFSGLAFLLLSGCSSHTVQRAVADGDRHLSQADLEQLVAGSILDMAEYGTEARVTLHPDGRLSARNNAGQKSAGAWKTTPADQLCLVFQKWHFGEKRCYSVYAHQDRYDLYGSAGRRLASFTISSPGNAAFAQQKKPTSSPIAAHHQARRSRQQNQPVEQYAAVDNQHLIRTMAQNCPGCRFAGANLNGAGLANANLAGADLAECDLRHADLRRARLRGANLRNANLAAANLSGADLANANLSGANLTNTNLYQAVLTNAILTGAQGADLDGAVGAPQ